MMILAHETHIVCLMQENVFFIKYLVTSTHMSTLYFTASYTLHYRISNIPQDVDFGGTRHLCTSSMHTSILQLSCEQLQFQSYPGWLQIAGLLWCVLSQPFQSNLDQLLLQNL